MALQNPIGIFGSFEQRKLGPLVLDAVVEETIGMSAAVTDHPIEVASRNGVARGEISDHVYLEPKTYTMRGVVSDFPITWRVVRDPYAEGSAATRSKSAFQILKRFFETREPFTVQTELTRLENMVIESLQFPRTSRTSRVMDFRAELREVQLVVPRAIEREISAEDVSGDQAEARAVTEQRVGQAPTAQPEQSVFSKVAEGIFP